MHRRSFLAIGSTAAIAPAAFCERAVGAMTGRVGRFGAPSVGVLVEAAAHGETQRLSAQRSAGRFVGAPCDGIRIEPINVPVDGPDVALEHIRDTVAGPIATLVWAMSGASVRSVGAPIAFAAPRSPTMRFRVSVGAETHEVELRRPRADGRGSGLIAIPLRRGVGDPAWRFWRAEIGSGSRVTGVHRPLGFGSVDDGRLLLAVTPMAREG